MGEMTIRRACFIATLALWIGAGIVADLSFGCTAVAMVFCGFLTVYVAGDL